MEDFIERFPTVTENILNELDNQSLVNFKEVSTKLCAFLNNHKLFSIRIVKAHKGSLVKYIEQWNKAVHKAPTEIINQLSDAVQVFFAEDDSRFEQQWYPIWIAAKSGNAQLCQHIIKKCGKLNQGDLGDVLKMVVEKGHSKVCKIITDILERENPAYAYDKTLLHIAAKLGHVETCRIFLNKFEHKNPKNQQGSTPLHFAAFGGHLEVCKLILENVLEKNPKNNNGDTPLHCAAEKGHLDICKNITKYIKPEGKNPSNNNGSTPLHYAAHNGHLEVCMYLIEKISVKNPTCNNRSTPLHMAANAGHIEICKFIAKHVQDANPVNAAGHTPQSLLNGFFGKTIFNKK